MSGGFDDLWLSGIRRRVVFGRSDINGFSNNLKGWFGALNGDLHWSKGPNHSGILLLGWGGHLSRLL